jgi:hypothetical protein
MNIRLPFWLVRRLAKRNPWLLSATGSVSRSLVVGVMFWEVTIDARLELPLADRERLIRERDLANENASPES